MSKSDAMHGDGIRTMKSAATHRWSADHPHFVVQCAGSMHEKRLYINNGNGMRLA